MEEGKGSMAARGVYIHIPFCERKCAYCSFYSRPPKNDSELDAYIANLASEIRHSPEIQQSVEAGGGAIDTIHIGGGTPSILSEENLQKLATAFSDAGCPLAERESTFEANPNSLTEAKIEKLREIGINRISIGAQSFNPHGLKTLGRVHSVSEIHQAVYAIRKYGFTNLGVDLIFGIPQQDFASAKNDIAKIISLAPEHISYYSLEVEAGTPLSAQIDSGELELPLDSLNRKIYRHAISEFTKAGYGHYEISNFAKPGFESKHNLKYWTGAEYIGIGDGAHSYFITQRAANKFSKRIVGGEVTELSLEDDMKEYIIMALRKIDGLSLDDFAARYGLDFLDIKGTEVKMLEESGLLTRPSLSDGGRIALTERGLDFANEVFREFL